MRCYEVEPEEVSWLYAMGMDTTKGNVQNRKFVLIFNGPHAARQVIVLRLL